MKTLLAICLLVAISFTTSACAAESPGVVTGEVLEVKDVDSYTYLRVKTRDGETWAAVTTAPLKPGATVTLENVMRMSNFESKALKRTFPTILFGTLAVSGKSVANEHPTLAQPSDNSPIKVSKASGANARTVAEVVTKAGELKDKPVQVRGKVVKYNPGIMGKNWIHLRDGSGAAADNSDDILVTTAASAKPGDVVTVSGVVRTDKDFGSGYSYKVLIEDAKLQP
jgi:hypothetical protein